MQTTADQNPYLPRIGIAQRGGTRDWCCDGVFVYRYNPDAVTAACVTDAPGSSEQIGHTARLLAEVAARMGARRSVFAGLSSASELVAVPQADDDDDCDAVAVLAAVRSSHTSIAWIGDCRAYSWDGERLVQVSTDQTMARWLAEQGNGHCGVQVPDDLSAFGNVYMRITLGLASAATIREVQIDAGLTVILTSDGVHDALGDEGMTDLVRAHGGSPQALADTLVSAPDIDEDGYRDDATVVVMAPPA